MTGCQRYLSQLSSLALPSSVALAVALIPSACVTAAEIRGTVSVQQGDLLANRKDPAKDMVVSIALFPAQGQKLPPIVARDQEMVVAGSQIRPLYIAVPRGSRLHFRSEDPAHHELFTHSHDQPLSVALSGARMESSPVVTLRAVGDLHWFCRIHARSYARVDVVDTSLVRTVRVGEPFEFRDLQPGKWRVRVAAPGAETITIETQALTTPPPLQIPLAITGLADEIRNKNGSQPVAVEQLFPSQPGL